MKKIRSGYQIYNEKIKKNTKVSLLYKTFPDLPKKKYSIIYADPPWHYNGKLQFDKTGTIKGNKGWKQDVFISSASLKYPTLTIEDLKQLDVNSIARDDCLLFLWTTNPHLKQAIDLGALWGFDYKTVGFVWNKGVHNPGQYTLSYCELCLIFKKGRIPRPRGVRNIKQLLEVRRTKHSEKPFCVSDKIKKMFPKQKRIELFARSKKLGWDTWGLEAIYKNKVVTKKEVLNDRSK